MFGNKSKPSKIYSYGAQTPVPAEAVYDQIRSAAEYRNNLVALERDRRRWVEWSVAERFPEIAELNRQIDAALAQLIAVRTRIKAANAAKRKREVSATDRTAAAMPSARAS